MVQRAILPQEAEERGCGTSWMGDDGQGEHKGRVRYVQISKGEEEGITSMSIDGKYYDIIHLDDAEMGLLTKGLDSIIGYTEPLFGGLNWPHMAAHVLRDKLEEVKNSA